MPGLQLYLIFAKSYLDASDLPVDLSMWSINSPKYLTVNTWTHCVVNITPIYVEVWLDDVLCSRRLRSYKTYQNNSSIETLIGNCAWCGQGSNNHFHGGLDELRVYNKTLTDTEIRTLFLEK